MSRWEYDDIKRLHDESTRAAQEAHEKARKVQVAIAEGLMQGLSPTALSRHLDLARSRVYQLNEKGKKLLHGSPSKN